jgi:purine catabolism regulator
MIKVVAGLIGNPVVILDSALNVVAESSTGYFSLEPGESKFDIDYYDLKVKADQAGKTAIYTVEGTALKYIVGPTRIGEIIKEYHVVYEENIVFDESDIELFKIILKACTLEMQKLDYSYFVNQEKDNGLLVKLIERKIKTRRYLEHLIRSLNKQVYECFHLAAFRLQEQYRDSWFILSTISRDLNGLMNGWLCTAYKGDIVLLFPGTETPFDSSLSGDLAANVGKYLSGKGLYGVISQKFKDLMETSLYYEQMINSFLLFDRLNIKDNLICAQDYLFYEMLSTVAGQQDILRYIFPKVRILLDFDARYGTELMDTLQVFIKNCLSIKKAAEAKFIHRNTMLYRVNRIKEVSGIDFESAEDLFLINMSFNILRFISPSGD